MSSAKSLPLPKRYPGKHVMRMKIWFPTWTMGFEGMLSPALANFLSLALTKGTSSVRMDLEKLTERLKQEPMKNVPVKGRVP